MQLWQIVTIVVAVLIVLAVLAWVYYGRQRSRRLQTHFGPEYDRTLEEFGDRRQAEANLNRRTERVSSLNIRPLTISDRMKFRSEWTATQSHFVDDPVDAVYEADVLVLGIMRARGFPAEEGSERFENLSAKYPWLATDYRQARQIVSRHRRGDASTEDMRQAMVHYRKIFAELLEEGQHEEFKRAS